jgi:phosphoribosyl 1,2-cyclic phosphodiesterase
MLGSGSSGNAVVIDCDGSRLLIDCGFGTRTLATRLAAAGIAPASIEACIITHEHSDHIKGAAAAARKWGWPLFASRGTARARELADVSITAFTAGDALTFTHMDIATAPTPHDASDPVGLIVTARRSGTRAGICYDIGHASDAVRQLCSEVDVLVLESNHDDEMLRTGPYPVWLRRRIAGDHGHLSNAVAAELARESVQPRLRHVVLAHLSAQNNTPATAHRNMTRALAGTAFRGTVSVALQDSVAGPFAPGERPGARAVQLPLGL